MLQVSRIFRWLYFVVPVFAAAAAIFYVSSLEKISVPDIGLNFEDKILHAFAYFVFGLIIIRAFHFGKSQPVYLKIKIITIIVGFLYGLSDEFHQSMVPGRSSEVWDWLADAVGIVMGAELYRRFIRVDMAIFQMAKRFLKR